MKTILVTGGAGFIGSCFVRTKTDRYNIVVLDALTYAGNPENMETAADDSRFRFIKGDICDRELLKQIFSEYEISAVINFAAESHVDRSIDDPEVFLRTNIMGTQALLDAARKSWSLHPGDRYCQTYREGVKFLQVSTDEVYGALGPDGYFREDSPVAPNSPYSASKASADMIALAYHHTFGIPLNITRCSNNYGAYQFPEKLIPLMINNALNNRPLPVYGDGLQVRDWLHVEDHCGAIETVLEHGTPGEIYNIGGNCECANIDIVKTILRIMDKPETLIQYVRDRPGHDRRYAIDNTKIKTELGWAPAYDFETGLHKTLEWFTSHQAWLNQTSMKLGAMYNRQ